MGRKMENKIVHKYIIIRIVCVMIVYLLGFLLVPYTPDIKMVRFIEWIILLLIVAISFYLIGRCQKKALKEME
jgi:ABC-type multidrug transport system fused ATPase/permease subunit